MTESLFPPSHKRVEKLVSFLEHDTVSHVAARADLDAVDLQLLGLIAALLSEDQPDTDSLAAKEDPADKSRYRITAGVSPWAS